MDEDLTFSSCADVRTSCSREVYAIRFLLYKHVVDNKAAATLFSSLALSRIRFNLGLVKPYAKRDLACLESVQRRFSKTCFADKTLSYSQRLTKLGWISVAQLPDIELLVFVGRLFLTNDSRCLTFDMSKQFTRRRQLVDLSAVGQARGAHFSKLAPHRAVNLFNDFLSRMPYDAYLEFLERKLSSHSLRQLCTDYVCRQFPVT